jgi:WD40 repeat protein
MKYIFTLILCLVSIQQADAQSLSLFNIDVSNFPTMKAKFFAFDAANKQQRPNKSELTITENGQPRTITNVTCPPDTIKSLSVCIMVDTYGYGLIKLAQAGTQRLINYLHPPNDETAIIMMNQGVQIHQDFTSDTVKAAASAATIPPAPGYVDVQKMFYYPYTGGVPFISGRTSDKKVLILVSDLHCPNLNLDTARLYQDAEMNNISVYAVLLGTTDYSGLFTRVAAKTGGKVFEVVRTESQITNIFQEIERSEHNIPCEITWEGGPSCIAGTDVEFYCQGQKSSVQYVIPYSSIAAIAAQPTMIHFSKKQPSSQNDTTLTISAQNADFIVTGIRRKFGSAAFSVVNTTFPITLLKNTSTTITLRFTPSDSSIQYASFEIETDKCTGNFSVNGSFPGKNPMVSTLKLTHPNGGERFVVGSDTVITWEGVAPSDSVYLSYSTDNGAIWSNLTTNATGLKYIWKNIPKPISSKCLVKVKQINNGNDESNAVLTLNGHTSNVWCVAFSPDGSKIVTSSSDSTARVWDAYSGSLLTVLSGNRDVVYGVAFSPDGSKIATSCWDGTAKVWNSYTGDLIWTLIDPTTTIGLLRIAFSPDANYLATTSLNSSIAQIWDMNTGLLILTLPAKGATSISYSPNGGKVATASYGGIIQLWDTKSGVSMYSTGDGYSVYRDISFHPDGRSIAVARENTKNNIQILDANTGAEVKAWTGHSSALGITYSPEGNQIATSGWDSTAMIWDSNTGELIRVIKDYNHRQVNDVAFSPDGSRLATTSGDKTAKVWDIGFQPIQEDVSDAVFSIIAPEPTLQNLSIDMGKVLVGQSKDSTVLGIICNKGLASLHVLGIDITSGDFTDFTIPRGAGDFFLDSNKRCQDVMFGFAPTKVGLWVAKATIRTTVGNFIDTITITGEGIAPELAIVNPFIDFGKTLVGTPKDSTKVVTIKNVGTADLTITQTDYNAFNTTNFSTLTGGNSFILKPNEEAIMDLRFLPIDAGRTSGILQFHYNGIGSPATVQLFGEGLYPSTTIVAQDITAQAGDKVNLTLKLQKSSGMQLTGSPTEWYARIHYNKSILYNEQTSNVCAGTTDSCVLELTGVYNPKSEELISIPCITTLGNTDHSLIVIDTFFWKNSAIVTEVATQNGTITLTGVCEDGGVRLFIPATTSTSLSTRPNPAQDNLQIQYGLREPLTVTLELLTMTGQVVQTILSNQSQVAGQYTLTSDLSVLGNGVYLLRMRTNKEMLTTRVDVVR